MTRSRSCYRCPVHCKAEIEIAQGRYAGTRGERPDIEPIINLEHLINLRLGASREDGDLPSRFTEERIADAGPTHGMTVDTHKLVSDFYAAMGWDREGHPLPETWTALDLDEFAPSRNTFDIG